jgi:alpha-glucosidase (family GH31 glycosyl hydrolase)
MQFIGEKPLDTLIVKVYPKDITSYTMYEDDGESYEYEKGAIAATRFECKKSDKQIEFIVHPVQGAYKGMYKSRTYELEIESANRPTLVKINNTPVSDWTYGEDKKVRVILHQKDVLSKATCVIL